MWKGKAFNNSKTTGGNGTFKDLGKKRISALAGIDTSNLQPDSYPSKAANHMPEAASQLMQC
eukprot:330212-Amphidinium_carterae.1